MASYVYEACGELFAHYPLATTRVNRSGSVRSMVLMVRHEDDSRFFVLSCDGGGGGERTSYSFFPWDAGDIIDIEDDNTAVPDVVVDAVSHGVPIPHDGSLFGWLYETSVTTLVPIYTEYAPESPEPSWAVMPRADAPEAQWPPFTDEHLFGSWFWDHYRAGNVISLGGLLAENPETAFWADAKPIIGSDCCVIVRDINSSDGHTLRRGRYVYYQALRTGQSLPSLDTLLAETPTTDLAPRFRSSDE